MKIFNKHSIRSNFYHAVSLVFVVSTTLWACDVIDDKTSTIIGAVLFFADYLAHMFDPHPENTGPWYKRYFHRMYDE